MQKAVRGIGLAMVTLLGAASLDAQVIFSDDFENGLIQWVGKNGGAHNGVVVADPLDATNTVLTFTGLSGAGDVYSTELAVDDDAVYELWFDYLGLAQEGSPPGNYGGYIGVSDQTPGYGDLICTCEFFGGTITDVGQVPWTPPQVELIDDGTWHSYAIPFQPFQLNDFVPTNGTIRVMVEDWNGGGLVPTGVPGDAYFDNIRVVRLAPVPVEMSTWGAIKTLYR